MDCVGITPGAVIPWIATFDNHTEVGYNGRYGRYDTYRTCGRTRWPGSLKIQVANRNGASRPRVWATRADDIARDKELVMENEAQWDAEEQAVFDACSALRAALHDDMRPAAYADLASTIAKSLAVFDGSEHVDMLAEAFRDDRMPGSVLGVIIMQHLPHVIDGGGMNREMKRYWMDVADELGPDWLESFNTANQWMKRVEGFK